MAEVRAALRLQLITSGLAEVQAATRAVQALVGATSRPVSGRALGPPPPGAARAATRARAAQIRTVESEMARLQTLEANRALTREARTRLGLPTSRSILTGHGFTAQSRQVLGLMRDVTVAGAGVRYAMMAVGGAFRAVIDPIREYQAELTLAQTKQHLTTEQLKALDDEARRLGRTTVFTPLAAAQAGTTLAAAGVHAPEIPTALAPTLQFAQAARLSTEDAAHALVQTATQFRLTASDYTHISDIFVKASNNSTAHVEDLTQALLYAGPVASQAGFSLENTAATLAVLAEGGIKADKAGTGLARVMVNLAKPTKKASETLKALGLSLADAQAGVADPQRFFEKLGAATTKYSKAQKIAIMNTLFGQRGQIAGLELSSAALRNNGQMWNQLTEKVMNARGETQATADAIGNTLDGRLKKLDASLQTAKLALGEAFLPAVMKVVPTITEAANATGQWIGANKELVAGAAKWGGASLAVVIGAKLAAGLVTSLASAEVVAGVTAVGTTLAGTLTAAIAAGIAGYALGTAILTALEIDPEQLGAKIYDLIHGSTPQVGRTKSVAQAIAERKAASANVRELPYVPMSKQNDLSLDLSGKPAQLPMSGKIDVVVTDDRVKVRTRSNSIPLRTGANAGAR